MPHIGRTKSGSVITMLMEYFPDSRAVSIKTLFSHFTEDAIASAEEKGYIRKTGTEQYVITEAGREYRNGNHK